MHSEDVDAFLQATATEHTSNQDYHQYYHQPNMTSQIVKRDLARTSTIESILEYVVAVQNKARTNYEADLTADEDEENLQPLMSVAGSYVIADGQPTTQFERILAQDALTGANRYANVHCLMGGFHTILKLHHAIGKLFDYIFKYYFGTYRRTQARIQYIQFQEG